jgi:hypothetical protein
LRVDRQIRLHTRAVLQRRVVQREYLFALAPIEARARLLAQTPLRNQRVPEGRHLQRLDVGVVGQPLFLVADDVVGDIESHKVGQAEHAAARATDQRAQQEVSLFRRYAVPNRACQRLHHRVDADARGDKARAVFRQHDALAQQPLGEGREAHGEVGVGVFGGDEFQQAHDARGIEKVRAQKLLA